MTINHQAVLAWPRRFSGRQYLLAFAILFPWSVWMGWRSNDGPIYDTLFMVLALLLMVACFLAIMDLAAWWWNRDPRRAWPGDVHEFQQQTIRTVWVEQDLWLLLDDLLELFERDPGVLVWRAKAAAIPELGLPGLSDQVLLNLLGGCTHPRAGAFELWLQRQLIFPIRGGHDHQAATLASEAVIEERLRRRDARARAEPPPPDWVYREITTATRVRQAMFGLAVLSACFLLSALMGNLIGMVATVVAGGAVWGAVWLVHAGGAMWHHAERRALQDWQGNYHEFQGVPIRIIWRDEQPWFAGADVCSALGVPEPEQLAARLGAAHYQAGPDFHGGAFSYPGLHAYLKRVPGPVAQRMLLWLEREVMFVQRRRQERQQEATPSDPS